MARFASGVASEVAQKTRGHRRGRVLSASGSKWVVQYNRGSVTVGAENMGEEDIVVGLWVTLGYVDGRLVITGPSAFQGPLEIPV
jgi:hypothetical protein